MVAVGDPVLVVQAADGLPVAGAISKPANGDKVAIAVGADGLPVAVKGGATVVCDGNPSIYLTVSGDVTNQVNWKGFTWNLPDDSGVTVEACPIEYALSPDPVEAWCGNGELVYNTISCYDVNWYLNSGITFYSKNTAPPYSIIVSGSLELVGPGAVGRPGGLAVLKPSTTAGTFWNGLFSTVAYYISPGGTPSTAVTGWYLITDELFGSYTRNGITFTWARGRQWPEVP